MMVSGHQYEEYDDEESEEEIYSDEEEEGEIEYEEEITMSPRTYEDYERVMKKTDAQIEPANVDTDTEAVIERELMKLPERPTKVESSNTDQVETLHDDEVDQGEEEGEEYDDEELIEEEEFLGEEEEEFDPENPDDIEELSEEGNAN